MQDKIFQLIKQLKPQPTPWAKEQDKAPGINVADRETTQTLRFLTNSYKEAFASYVNGINDVVSTDAVAVSKTAALFRIAKYESGPVPKS